MAWIMAFLVYFKNTLVIRLQLCTNAGRHCALGQYTIYLLHAIQFNEISRDFYSINLAYPDQNIDIFESVVNL